MASRCSVGKRSNFERKPRDFYPTPIEALVPLLPHLPLGVKFDEPCAGGGHLVQHLEHFGGRCSWASDVEPQAAGVRRFDALALDKCRGDVFLTNPPWDRKILHPLIEHLSEIAPTWLLFDADWLHTKQSSPFLPRLKKVVSIGRVKWIPDSKMTGKDNCMWALFDKPDLNRITIFRGRVA